MKQQTISILICVLAIMSPYVSQGQADILYIQFYPQSKATFLKEIGGGNYADELTYQKSVKGNNEIAFRVKGFLFVHKTRTMQKTVIPRKNITFSSGLTSPEEVEKYIITLTRQYPFGGLPSQPGVKKLFIVEDEGGDFLTIYEVKWQYYVE